MACTNAIGFQARFRNDTIGETLRELDIVNVGVWRREEAMCIMWRLKEGRYGRDRREIVLREGVMF